VMARPLVHFGHNYNYVSRAVMYHWLNRHLKLGLEEPIVEEDYKPLSKAEMGVWDEEHPRPPGGDEHERALLRWITEDSRKQMAALLPKDKEGLARYREIVGGALDVMIGRGLPQPEAVRAADLQEQDLGDWRMAKFLVRHTAEGEELPAVRLQPKSWNKRTVIWIDRMGKQSLFDEEGASKASVRKLLSAGVAVVGVDLFGQGEFNAEGKPMAKARLVNKDYAGYTFGYNHPVFSKRVHDVLATVALLKSGDTPAEKVYLVGLAGAGHWVAAASAQADDAVDGAMIDTDGFRFADLTALDDPDFLPGGAKYGDLPGMIALSAPHPLWLAGEGPKPPPVVAAAYKAAGQPDNLTLFPGKEQHRETAAVEWLLR